MKKKIVNVILSVAVVTSMMFAVTACGSKDNDKAPAESAAVTNTVEDAAKADTEDTAKADAEDTAKADTEDTEKADTEDTAKADAEGGMTAEDWVNSEEASTYVNLFNTMFNGAMTTEFEAEGNTLSMVFILSTETLGTDGSDLTDEQKVAMETQMQQQYDGLKDQFEPMRDELKKTIGASDLVVQIIYRTSNGTELFSQEL
ncbi:MAG: DUF4854 domain-containing protein [Lachnospiraceae bacterium]|nr:DUF4854 domain-containing protein [Lachnospiraceae bacterium]